MDYILDFTYISIAFIAAFLIKKYLLRSFWGAPVGILAGVIALFLSDEFLGLFHFSGNLNHYISYLLCIIFASFPLSISRIDNEIITSTKSLWKYSILQHCLQWSIGILLATYVVSIFSENTAGFLGAILPAGFAGGHGSSAVIGSIFARKGFEEVFSLAMMMATIGTFFSLFGGLLWIGSRAKNQAFEQLNTPKRPSLKISVLFGFILIFSYLLKLLLNKILFFDIPMLATGVAIGLIARLCLKSIANEKQDIDNFVSIVTSLLVGLGIAAIKIVVIKKYILLIFILSIVSVVVSILLFAFVGTKKLGANSFEKSLFTWGWSTGGIVFGLSLVEIVKNSKSDSLLQVLALSYLLISPLEICLILTMPALLLAGYGTILAVCLLLLAVALLVSILRSSAKSLK